MSARIAKLGFTLIELLVVISIIGILATLIAANLNSARSRARDAQRKSDLRNVATALRLYYNDKSVYPNAVSFGLPWTDGSTVYMSQVPQDSLSPDQVYRYYPDAGYDTFTLLACLENRSDKQGIANPNPQFTCPTAWVFQVAQ
ncbi:MAG: pilin domain-containing protein, general secretion pathway protein G [Microgenomates group bacterium GW2011_GWC1_43_13]|uniref:General secretion pathway protein G n=3 Tax=Candidatus Woeseibacteriota TaxID=1752722 RepID=A0A837IDA2_9BACT|nr:MAG: pilin domain-containing protein, general secretion pathway protein G [Microgenomates group bacterium GW2011_GWC1_43_13]KKT32567.1 MAG: hypothetical protein UW20_C0012G0013 [Candidatus Woesebacteria bacterium GW2011_GWB1_44_11]KKT54284.1 MAG: hypothetical protein UW47_C0007G0004 [Candidatus Woesebacteria bacterium GW2011_GWA1_44_23]OGM76665.1 MAG: hypothetical protein A2208_03090 [Candidatus Woesebacteria bacterium RIFOXYA1_FULL_43_16]OGM83160.1 MAG: hypothetical protein A2394_02645 [Can